MPMSSHIEGLAPVLTDSIILLKWVNYSAPCHPNVNICDNDHDEDEEEEERRRKGKEEEGELFHDSFLKALIVW